MRFGTKILLLTLALTLGLSGIIVLIVRSEITQRETRRARADIRAAADRYLGKLDAIQKQVSYIVLREMSDPNNRAALELLGSESDRETTRSHFSEYIFGRILHADLDSPTFHALVSRAGEVAVATAVGAPALEAALRSQPVAWRIERLLRADGALQREYLLIDNVLYLAFAAPLRQTSDEAPAYVYFAGRAVTDEFARQLLDHRAEDAVDIAAWFIVADRIVARGSEQVADPASRQARLEALLAQVDPAALPHEPRDVTFSVAGERFVGQYTMLEPAPGVRGVLALTSSLEQQLAPLRRLERQIALFTAALALLAVATARAIARRLARPVEILVEGTQRIARGDFSQSIPVQRHDELGTLARSFNEMAAGLAQRDLIKDTLGQFVDPRIAEALLTNPSSLRGRRVVQSVLFSDLEKFTSLAERLDPETLVRVLNRFLGASADVVKELNGYLDKFTGDGVVAFWGPPVEARHSLAACRAALRMVDLTKQFDHPPLRARFGIATGEVLVGIVGSESSKKNYTAMGDVVNLASRLEGANKVYGTDILIDTRTASDVGASMGVRRIDVIRVVGRTEPVELFELLGSDHPRDTSAERGYAQALELYQQGRFAEAHTLFASLSIHAARALAERCAHLLRHPPALWDGVWDLDSK